MVFEHLLVRQQSHLQLPGKDGFGRKPCSVDARLVVVNIYKLTILLCAGAEFLPNVGLMVTLALLHRLRYTLACVARARKLLDGNASLTNRDQRG